MALLATHSLGEKWSLSWNVGVSGALVKEEAIFYTTAYQWSLAREITDNFGIFFQGYMNDAALPRVVSPISGGNSSNATVIGAGFNWAPFERIAFCGSANAGVNRAAPETVIYMGTAFSF